jgi:hypothetical protein
VSDFTSFVKSTIDKAGVDIATAFGGGTQFVDLDDSVKVAELMSGSQSAIVWTLLTLGEDPIAPLYSLTFGIGAKTTTDPGNYNMTDLLDAVKAVIQKGSSMAIRDWSPGGDSGAVAHGTMFITDVFVDPQLFDKESGIRLISVAAKAVDDG